MIPDLGGSSVNPNAVKGSGFDPTAAIGLAFSTITSLVFAQQDANAQKRLEEKINKLSLAQKIELENKLKLSNNEIEQMQILYKTLNLSKHNLALASFEKEQKTGLIILASGILILTIFIVLKKHLK